MHKLKSLITDQEMWTSAERKNDEVTFLLRFRPNLQAFIESQIKTAANNALAKYGAGRCNFIISNIAGLVRGWTFFV